MASWIVPANLNYYDVFAAFEQLKKVDWKQSSSSIAVGDVVYIYVSNPIKAVMFKCRVNKVCLPNQEIDDSAFSVNGEVFQNKKRYMELEAIKKYSEGEIPFDVLANHGLNGPIMSQRRLPLSVSEFLESI